MKYEITMLTFDEPIPTGTVSGGFAPWSNSHVNVPFDLGGAQEDIILLEDDDSSFNSRYRDLDKTGQSLIQDTVFGNDPSAVPTGTRLASFIGSRIEDSHGNHFRVMFPRVFSEERFGTELGNKHSVLVFPEPRQTEDGTLAYPIFDRTETFRFIGTVNVFREDQNVPDYPPSVPCFTTGSLIETTSGPRPIETLCPGDLVVTRDHGPRSIAWIGHRHVDNRQLDLCLNLRPILLRAGALGPGLPERDLTVSPQHRILVNSRIARRMFDQDEILVAAKHLANLPGIEVLCPEDGVTYWHMLFDNHELVLSNGTWTESLFTGPQAMQSLGGAARREILSLFPKLAQPGYRPRSARRLLNGREGRKLAKQHVRNGKPLVSDSRTRA
ncbi:Hint domain-containing protein [Paracoccus saliphilus]|uniref:Hint domain-containing protein n=2 Tax=Paracoccus saliphilus TaxID=405559 RepID=A0AA45W6B9_9RHOB|nr:Hint domain-containing protein [Paracoccus saliphilus]SIT00961.1 Hint domain-containing protein [Paracoccus saliphilus]